MAIQASAIFLGDSRADAPTTVAVHHVQRLVREAAERHPSNVGIQFLFHVGGPGHGPGYKGVRTGSFRKAKGQKEIQIAVPETLETTPEDFLARGLEEGLALATQSNPPAPYFLKVYGFGSSTALSQVSPACPNVS
jgi:hypothetical protein